ncbi:SEL1-like repeat protein [Shewanella avicenniae]|uniref:SEL1-like repeat protein n=1 Tax=Shewanella avicenniae TaxID=2814294 RepID=A0ABX7QSH2_9GAMM|nr:SEL1-like repeat protein [Shewanella avicenniae]QSX34359.1 SEL1-like repeat protein [Shewanella avicenniae]
MRYSAVIFGVVGGLLTLSAQVAAFSLPQPQQDQIAGRVALIQYNAERGEAQSQYLLGLMYISGRYVDKDIDSGMGLLKQAAAANNADAQRALADLSFEGRIVARDLSTAEHWYRKLAETGDHWANFRLGFVYAAGGAGVVRDCGKAVKHFSDAGDKVSMGNVVWILATCPESQFRDGERAVALATELLKVNEADPTFLDNLAAAYAETGDYANAVKTQQQALVQLHLSANQQLKTKEDEFQKRLDNYLNHKPYREILPLD